MNLSPTWRAKFDEKIETSHFKIYLRSVPSKTHFNQNIYFRHIYLRYLAFPSKKHPLPQSPTLQDRSGCIGSSDTFKGEAGILGTSSFVR